jgi:hypothetical protein
VSADIKTRTTMTIGEHVEVVIDPEEWDWHIDCRPGFTEIETATAVGVVVALGMEIYEAEECESTVLEDGTIRYWMSPKEAVPE